MIIWHKCCFIWQFPELGFHSIQDNAIFSPKGQFLKALDCELVDGIFTQTLPKYSCKSLQNSILFLVLFFMPLAQIGHVSLNLLGSKLQQAKTIIVTKIDEIFITLDSRNHIIAKGIPLLWFQYFLIQWFLKLGFV
jgi:hypothetical protein